MVKSLKNERDLLNAEMNNLLILLETPKDYIAPIENHNTIKKQIKSLKFSLMLQTR